MNKLAEYAITIFLSSFLLFQVQPIIAKLILPWFGGGSAVWTTCMLFFQVSLLAGYAYAHFLSKHVKLSSQPLVHIALLVLSLAALPIAPDEAWKPSDPQNPAWEILILLFASIGAPFLLVASTNPLLQHWLGSTIKTASPYRLYALSNIGSMLALISYPFLVEPYIGLNEQTTIWSIGYVVFVLGAGWCGIQVRRQKIVTLPSEDGTDTRAQKQDIPDNDGAPATPINYLLWLLLSACGVILLLATTNQMTLDIAPIPFLWILPLSIYLISFIICFDHSRWYIRRIWVTAYCVSLVPAIFLLFFGKLTGAIFQISLYSVILFTACMVCHGELVRLKPPVKRLTSFYLTMSLGGALGGVFVAIAAPLIFTSYAEYYIGVFGAGLLVWLCGSLDTGKILAQFQTGKKKGKHRKDLDAQKMRIVKKQIYTTAFCLLAGLVLISFFFLHASIIQGIFISQSRNFYGTLGVSDTTNPAGQTVRELADGTTVHGSQILHPKYRKVPTGYFRLESGFGVTARFLDYAGPLNLGVIGLGAGTIAAYGEKGDVIRFYEINPAVKKTALEYFYFLRDSRADTTILLGDGRISLERELIKEGSRQFHILAVDAFSNDAPPVHLLTKEAFALYFSHVGENGVLAVNITNAHLDLSPVVRNLAKEFNKSAVLVKKEADRFSHRSSQWVLVTSNKQFLNDERVKNHITPWRNDTPKAILWTDDYSNLVSVLSRSGTKFLFQRLFHIVRSKLW